MELFQLLGGLYPQTQGRTRADPRDACASTKCELEDKFCVLFKGISCSLWWENAYL